VLKCEVLPDLPEEIFEEILSYETEVRKLSDIFQRHRRRVNLQQGVKELRNIGKFEKYRYTGVKRKIEKEAMRLILKQVYLEPKDVESLGVDYDNWSEVEMVDFLLKVLNFPEAQIHVLV